MSRRTGTLLVVAAAAVLAVGMGWFAWRNARVSETPELLLRRLPTQDAVVAGVDFKMLRRSGFLDFLEDAKTPQDAEYLAFVRDTGFNYRRDLNYALAAFAPDGEFFLVKGNFDWGKLERYAAQQKGSCADHFCRLTGSTAEKKISFFPLAADVMAMAVAPDPTAAMRLKQSGPQGDMDVPPQPAWVTFSAGALRHSTSLPESSKLFASAITSAERVTITAGQNSGKTEARLDAVCPDAQQAGALTEQLRAVTEMLRGAAQREGKAAGPGDLAGVLTAGTFEQAGSHVVGHWPISKALIANLAGGI